jgi:hypothetical protein
MDEPDTEHEDLPVEEEPWPGLLEERMNLLRDALQADDPRDARERLERFLGTMEDYEFRQERSGQRHLETRYCRYWPSTRHIGYAGHKCFAQWMAA